MRWRGQVRITYRDAGSAELKSTDTYCTIHDYEVAEAQLRAAGATIVERVVDYGPTDIYSLGGVLGF